MVSPLPGLENGHQNGANAVAKWCQNEATMAYNACWRRLGQGLRTKRLILTKQQYVLYFISISMIIRRSVAVPLVHKMPKSELEQGLGKHIESQARKHQNMVPKRYPK